MRSSAPPWDLEAVAPDVAIVIALAEEFQTLAAAVTEGRHAVRNPDFGGYDYVFMLHGHRCVATVVDAMGPTAASQSAQRLLALRPAVIVNLGIAVAGAEGQELPSDAGPDRRGAESALRPRDRVCALARGGEG